jgi:hypothetical protein
LINYISTPFVPQNCLDESKLQYRVDIKKEEGKYEYNRERKAIATLF